MKKSKAARIIVLRAVCRAVREDWRKHGKSNTGKWPWKKDCSEEQRTVAAQLCNWKKDGYGADVHLKPIEWSAR